MGRGRGCCLPFEKGCGGNTAYITKTRVLKNIENFTAKEHFQIKNSDIFQISAQNRDCDFLAK